ncbi:histidine phosphatase family protein [Jeotgalibaca caeni]|uniref:histidine phosphatase family protein n=1 Tax=Jeotgalibaca caeni TaxID=3028623 RepID=UPI00237E2582|nr:histidine phosphatase family protein [Jeotgalibaca caeni]MDE1548842.1 histidine phosphatase family protein [Jeotgalibaca caeni]
MSKGVTFYFMRHGETYLNQYNRMQGWSDAPLTNRGKRDVARSGAGLSDVKFDAVYCSDLRRTFETAQIILKENEMVEKPKVVAMPEFREIFFGSFEGLDAPETWAKLWKFLGYEDGIDYSDHRSVIQELNGMRKMDPYHEAEDYLTFWLRVERGLIKLIDEHRETGRNILVVSHGMTIRNMIHALIPDFEIDRHLDNASISVVSYHEGFYHLEKFNSIEHFAPDNTYNKETEPATHKIMPLDKDEDDELPLVTSESIDKK